jgi:hypothetical protein
MDDKFKSMARPATSRSLREAIQSARLEEALHLDQTADKRDSEIARLELLKAELQSVFADVPANDERFSLTLVPSRPARLWVDVFTYVCIDDDNGAYLLVRNSEQGRRTLFSSVNVADMADRVTSHMAREIVRRERQEAALLEPSRKDDRLLDEATSSGSGTGVVAAAFIVGMLTGAAALFAAVWFTLP